MSFPKEKEWRKWSEAKIFKSLKISLIRKSSYNRDFCKRKLVSNWGLTNTIANDQRMRSQNQESPCKYLIFPLFFIHIMKWTSLFKKQSSHVCSNSIGRAKFRKNQPSKWNTTWTFHRTPLSGFKVRAPQMRAGLWKSLEQEAWNEIWSHQRVLQKSTRSQWFILAFRKYLYSFE